MRLKINYSRVVVALLGCLLTIGCKYDTDIAHPEDYVKIYMPQAIDNPATYNLIMSDTAQLIVYGANYGGVGYPASDIKVHFEADPSLTADYNAAHQTAYLPMPDGSYELETAEAVIPKGKTSTDPLTLKVKTIGSLDPNVQYLLPIKITTSVDSLLNDKLKITYFVIRAKYDLINVSMAEGDKDSVLHSLNMADTAQTIYYSAQYRADVEVNTDISLAFDVKANLVDSFNAYHGTSYPVMPEGSYTLSATNATIQKGETATDQLQLKVKTRGHLTRFVKYLLPVTLTEASGDLLSPSKKVVIDEDKATSYFLIQATAKGIELTIMSYGKNSGDNDLESLANLVKQYNPDLLYIRQLDKNTSRSGPEDQPRKLSQLLGMPNYIFFKGLDYQGGEYGDGLFSKFPINQGATKTYELSSSGSEKGTLGIIQLKLQDTLALYFAGTHLNASYSNKMTQTAELLEITKDYSGSFILAGAFNGRPNGTYDNMNKLDEQFTFPCNCDAYDQYVMYKQADDFQVLSYQEIDADVTKYKIFLLKVKWYYED